MDEFSEYQRGKKRLLYSLNSLIMKYRKAVRISNAIVITGAGPAAVNPEHAGIPAGSASGIILDERGKEL